jgi:hypothetical protein
MAQPMKYTLTIFTVLLLAPLAFAADKPNEFLGAEYGDYNTGKGRSIAATGKDAAVISLAGEWRCALDPDRKGIAALQLDKPIRFPGTLNEAGYGEPRDEKTLRCLSRRFNYVGPAWYQREIVIPPDWTGGHDLVAPELLKWFRKR